MSSKTLHEIELTLNDANLGILILGLIMIPICAIWLNMESLLTRQGLEFEQPVSVARLVELHAWIYSYQISLIYILVISFFFAVLVALM